MKAAIYARTTSQEQSTAEQIDLCREYIRENCGQIVGIFDDPGVSAHVMDRDGLMELAGFLARGEADTLIVTSLDRLFRDLEMIRAFLKDIPVETVVVKQL